MKDILITDSSLKIKIDKISEELSNYKKKD